MLDWLQEVLTGKKERGPIAAPPSDRVQSKIEELVDYAEIRKILDNISLAQKQNGFRWLAVLSLLPAEGKSLVCATLALAYARTWKKRVLIVDTSTQANEGSLKLSDCFGENGSDPFVDVVSLRDEISKRGITSGDATAVEALRAAIGDSYSLVLVDTTPLTARNRNNYDPLVLARRADASVLVASQTLLGRLNLNAHLKMIDDPHLHLIGVISNEEFG